MPPGLSSVTGALRLPVDVVSAVPDLLGRAGSLLTRLESLLDDAEGALGRVHAVVDDAETQIARVAAVAESAERQVREVGDVADAAAEQVRAVGEITDSAAAQVDAVGDVVRRSDEAVGSAAATAERAEQALTDTDALLSSVRPAIERTKALLDQGEGMLAPIQQPLTDLMPSLARFAEAFDPDEVDALITLVDRLPIVVEHVDDEILPLMRSLGGAAPDIHGLLETVQRIEPVVDDIRSIFTGLPGAKLLRRRNDDETG
jgi:ABC-type transporter Mla subunit MlaD